MIVNHAPVERERERERVTGIKTEIDVLLPGKAAATAGVQTRPDQGGFNLLTTNTGHGRPRIRMRPKLNTK